MDITKYMNKAISIATIALDEGELPVGAIIVHKDKILAESYTQDRKQQRRLAHAEFLVLDQVDKLKPSTVERKNMMLFTNLEPCILCLGAAMAFGIGKIYYALESPIDGASKLLNYYFDKKEYSLGYSIPDIQGGILREESKNLFKKYITLHPTDGIIQWTKLLLETVSRNTR
ncbi:MAG: nucleoside deaminase [Candidatus Hermodarchaeota archaeon]